MSPSYAHVCALLLCTFEFISLELHFHQVNVSILPGDRIVTHCIWTNTVEYGTRVGNPRAAAGLPVLGGEGTAEEMCMTFLFYYPRVPNIPVFLESPTTTFCDDDVNRAAGLPTCSEL